MVDTNPIAGQAAPDEPWPRVVPTRLRFSFLDGWHDPAAPPNPGPATMPAVAALQPLPQPYREARTPRAPLIGPAQAVPAR